VSEEPIFGTDGIRGRAGVGWLSKRAVAALGRAAGRVLAERGDRALVGHDGRRSGPTLETALCSGLRESGVEVVSAGLITTPGLAWLTRTGNFALGAMLSASHNPSEDNGVKFFSNSGGKLSDAHQADIEKLLRADEQDTDPDGVPPGHELALEGAYLTHLVTDVAAGLSLTGMTIALDCANGGGSRVAPKVFGRLGAQVHAMGAEPDGDNINAKCGSTYPDALQTEVRAHGAQIGIALDGDGDRCMLVDEHGDLVNGDGIMTVIGRQEAAAGRLSDPRIVATVMSNRGLHRALRELGVKVVEVPVGDRAVVEAMHREHLCLGGEQSGHIIMGGEDGYIGDGVVTALAVLRVMRETGQPLSELVAPYQPFPQVLRNVLVTSKPALSELPEILERVRQVEEELGQDGRVLVRYSGTEDLARIMVEGPDQALIQRSVDSLSSMFESRLGTNAG